MKQGLKYIPIYDRLHGVFCWFRIGDQETTLWDTGIDAQELYEWCNQFGVTPEDIDERAEREFEEQKPESLFVL